MCHRYYITVSIYYQLVNGLCHYNKLLCTLQQHYPHHCLHCSCHPITTNANNLIKIVHSSIVVDMAASVSETLHEMIKKEFLKDDAEAAKDLQIVQACLKHRPYLTVFRIDSGQDIDHAMLHALLKGQSRAQVLCQCIDVAYLNIRRFCHLTFTNA